MKKISFVAIIATIMAIPAFADIAANNNNPTCDSTTIGATSGDTALDATWNANTLNLKFMANGQQFASNTCTYGQNITIPSTEPTRTGYNFAGWVLGTNAVASTPCSQFTDPLTCPRYYYKYNCDWVEEDNECADLSEEGIEARCDADPTKHLYSDCDCACFLSDRCVCGPYGEPVYYDMNAGGYFLSWSDEDDAYHLDGDNVLQLGPIVGCSLIGVEDCDEYANYGCSIIATGRHERKCIALYPEESPNKEWCEADGYHWCKDSCQAEACE